MNSDKLSAENRWTKENLHFMRSVQQYPIEMREREGTITSMLTESQNSVVFEHWHGAEVHKFFPRFLYCKIEISKFQVVVWFISRIVCRI